WSSYLATRVGFMHIEPTIKNPSDAKREKYVKDTPRNSLAASLIYNPIHSIDIMPSLRYESKRYYDNENGKTNNSFTLVDFKVAYRPIRDLEFSTGVKNIFDKYYYYDIRFPQEGRQFYANVRYQF
ncbi:MAG: TonB-dependent receptor, partial [Sulfurospirillaceae bacterium]|nr:TonB-dependent receptor [Sulfurospirillaceae bacterium]